MTKLPATWLVDFDGTLAHYTKWQGASHAGPPIPLMLQRVRSWLAKGKKVKIFTARVWPYMEITADADVGELRRIVVEHGAPAAHNPGAALAANERRLEALESVECVRAWCETWLGQRLDVTCAKDFMAVEIWDDRAHGVRINTGQSEDGLRLNPLPLPWLEDSTATVALTYDDLDHVIDPLELINSAPANQEVADFLLRLVPGHDYLWRLKGLPAPITGVVITRGPLLTAVAALALNHNVLTPNSHA